MFSKYVDVRSIAVHYYHTGRSTLPGVPPSLDQGELLLFLHGAGSNAHTWHRQLDHFEQTHSAVALDFPGHGRSGSTEGLASLKAYADLTATFAEALALRPCVVVGRAMGGAIAALLALQRPELVRGLVLVATPARFEIPRENLDTWHDVMRGRKTQPFSTTIFSPKTDLSIMREVWTEQVQTDPRVRYFDLLACNGVNLGDPLSRITVPTLVITGRDDHFAPPDKVQEVQKIVPNATMVVVDDAGHALTSEKPQEFHQAVDAFLQGLE